MDFTIKKYKELLTELCRSGYSFQTFNEFITKPLEKVVVLRHDVDRSPLSSMKFAVIQNRLGIRGSYYFRVVAKSFDADIIQKISALGHEIGYHYETLDNCKGNIDLAYKEFCVNLEMLRNLVSVKTICMHGSPMSRFDNRAVWDKFNYKELGIVAEPYFDVDYNKVFYITDTGRRFDGSKVSIRDKALNKSKVQWPSYHSTDEVILALQKDTFPDVVIFTFHPQRWTDNLFFWNMEFVSQNLKNCVKGIIVRRRTYL
jgi:hypothetical protein